MSVLKYNNNGNWEGLNIDHASTADSALYDADGNVISSTYLPRSAGSDHPLTGSLWLEAGADNWREVAFEREGNKEACVSSGLFLNSNYFVVSRQNNNGDLLGGMQVKNNDNVVFANQGVIALRPNGVDSTTGQVYLEPNGKMQGAGFVTALSSDTIVERVGSMFFIHAYLSTTTSCPNNAFTTIRTITDTKFRPTSTAYGIALGFGNKQTMAIATVTTGGLVQVQPWTSTTGTQSWLTYICWRNPNFTP